jgi:2-methylcitrate dehydratase PrpD
MTQPDAAHRLAAHAVGLRFADLPPAAVAQAKVFILDTLGVGIAGGSVPEAAPLLATARGWGEGQGAVVWGSRARLAPGAAALVNAFQVHCQEYDNLHEGAVLHAMATLLPVLLAEAEVRGGISGEALITAVVAGVDVAGSRGLAAPRLLGRSHFGLDAAALLLQRRHSCHLLRVRLGHGARIHRRKVVVGVVVG